MIFSSLDEKFIQNISENFANRLKNCFPERRQSLGKTAVQENF